MKFLISATAAVITAASLGASPFIGGQLAAAAESVPDVSTAAAPPPRLLEAESPLSAEELAARKDQKATGARAISDGLVELDDSSIDEFINSTPTTLVLFYAFWCHWCKDLLPKFREAARILSSKGSTVTLGQIDASRNLEAAETYDVRAYPTLRMFLDGYSHDYAGGRTAREIVSWMEQHIATEDELSTVAQLEGLLEASKSEPLVIARLNAEEHSWFHAASRHVDHVHFAFAGNDDIVEELISRKILPKDADQAKFVVLVNPHHEANPKTEEYSVVYNGAIQSEDELSKFCRSYLFPAIVEFNYETAPLLLQDGRDIVALLSEDDNPGKEELEAFRLAASEFRGKALFVTAGGGFGAKRLHVALGVEALGDSLPTVRVLRNPLKDDRQKFKLDAQISGRNVAQFVEKVLEGQAKPWMKSEEISDEEPSVGEVKSLVALQWQKKIKETNRDVFLMVYAPWCGHCKQLEPTFENVAAYLAAVPSVDVMRIDATRNEIPIPITGYPTIMLFTGSPDDRQTHYYSGDRTVEAMVTWVAAHSGSPFDAKKILDHDGGHAAAMAGEKRADEL